MTRRLAIRAPRPDEMTAAGELAVAAYEAEDLLSPAGTYRARLRDVAGRMADSQVAVAVADGGEVLGTVTLVAGGGSMREVSRDGEAEFRMLAVAPAAAGRGVGTALLEWVMREARAHGAQRLVCSSQRDMYRAHRLYERHGFRRAPERDWSPVEGVVLQVFVLDLQPDPRT